MNVYVAQGVCYDGGSILAVESTLEAAQAACESRRKFYTIYTVEEWQLDGERVTEWSLDPSNGKGWRRVA